MTRTRKIAAAAVAGLIVAGTPAGVAAAGVVRLPPTVIFNGHPYSCRTVRHPSADVYVVNGCRKE